MCSLGSLGLVGSVLLGLLLLSVLGEELLVLLDSGTGVLVAVDGLALDEVLAAWQFIDPIIDMTKDTAPHLYREGTMGPADTLLAKAGRDWIDPSEDG